MQAMCNNSKNQYEESPPARRARGSVLELKTVNCIDFSKDIADV